MLTLIVVFVALVAGLVGGFALKRYLSASKVASLEAALKGYEAQAVADAKTIGTALEHFGQPQKS
jgi:hypothetical protein